MEFRCRLASPNGEIVEGVYVADNEARLRHELEEKGLFVLSLQPKHAIGGVALQLPQRRSVNTREFLVFNQELATLLKAGMPLVQSLGLLKGRVTSPTFRRVLDDVHEKVRSGTALSDAFAAPSALGGASGGPDWPLIAVWKAAAPHINALAPDIYARDSKAYLAYLDRYARAEVRRLFPGWWRLAGTSPRMEGSAGSPGSAH